MLSIYDDYPAIVLAQLNDLGIIKDENLDIFEIGKIEVNKSSRCTIS